MSAIYRETLADDPTCSNFLLRPIHDQLLDEMGDPPFGIPDECTFAKTWPASAEYPPATKVVALVKKPRTRTRAIAKQASA